MLGGVVVLKGDRWLRAKRLKKAVGWLDGRYRVERNDRGLDTENEVITLDGNRAVLKQAGKELVAEILEPAGVVFTVESARQKPPEEINKGVNRLIVRSQNCKGKVRIAVLLAPAWPKAKKQSSPKLKPLSQW